MTLYADNLCVGFEALSRPWTACLDAPLEARAPSPGASWTNKFERLARPVLAGLGIDKARRRPSWAATRARGPSRFPIPCCMRRRR